MEYYMHGCGFYIDRLSGFPDLLGFLLRTLYSSTASDAFLALLCRSCQGDCLIGHILWNRATKALFLGLPGRQLSSDISNYTLHQVVSSQFSGDSHRCAKSWFLDDRARVGHLCHITIAGSIMDHVFDDYLSTYFHTSLEICVVLAKIIA